ncbi:DUF4160 domain-containing protein [Candidatus Hamiltonella defensa]|uniref:DUF4160 domain-containing protein n=1 Tax=Candidatus Williamhamiltonella defendens TaxID=138072 RepID=A0A4P2SS13_9ENTR|nr:DUF4160 domain-containing protein [Candidatus Hamiltonella defensa]ASV34349.1 DUF4160 domain-containing protein [Candidatus Hamiltonella defensa]AWK17307.1 hypothetical protein CCS40_03965 [Candidatus Hamiltonella defensa]AYB48954.1 DUF4160 domain-containing protein [Candidatus Hamiltonella defensa]MBK4362177.1 DUF4160 domain-containing protein [Candidatus Hamiltonella defensa]
MFFYSNEGNPREPAHIHIRNAENEAKFWLIPRVQLARNDGFNVRELKEIHLVIEKHKILLEEAWNEYFS